VKASFIIVFIIISWVLGYISSQENHPEADKIGYGNGRADIYWVDAKKVDPLRPENF